jgi:hypothetical protein
MDERPKLPHYDPDYCLRVAKWEASVCVGILVIELVVLLFVAPSNGKCPGWTIYAENGSAMPSWILAGIFTGGPTIWICYIVLRWEQKFSEKIYDSIAYGHPEPPFSFFFAKQEPHPKELNFQNIFLVNFNRLFLVINVGWCFFCALPLWMMLSTCTNLPRYLGY